VAYGAWHPKWTWWFGVVANSVVRFYFFPRDARLDPNLREIGEGAHLLVTAYARPAGWTMWRQGIMELSREEIVFYGISLFPRQIATWKAGVWKTRTRSPSQGDSLFLRFGWPRMLVIECERGSDSMTVAAMRSDFKLIESLLSNQNGERNHKA
jgi:hypothetical protein